MPPLDPSLDRKVLELEVCGVAYRDAVPAAIELKPLPDSSCPECGIPAQRAIVSICLVCGISLGTPPTD